MVIFVLPAAAVFELANCREDIFYASKDTVKIVGRFAGWRLYRRESWRATS
jgi:hypothetical protein